MEKDLKKEFLSTVSGVTLGDVYKSLSENSLGLDMYTFFTTDGAHCSGYVDEVELGEFASLIYSDWYCLNRSNLPRTRGGIEIFSKDHYKPSAMSGDDCLALIRSEVFKDTIPMYISNLNSDKYFFCVDFGKLYGKHYNTKYNCRLYLNLKSESLVNWAKDFANKAYLYEFPAFLKILNNDYRNDTITIYTDFEYVQKVVDAINEILSEFSEYKKNISAPSKLLGITNDFIGVGENSDKGGYLSSRCKALMSIKKFAEIEVLKNAFVSPEKKMIESSDGTRYTPNEYMKLMILKNANKLIDSKIILLENTGENSGEIEALYSLKKQVQSDSFLDLQLKTLKSSLTRDENYKLSLNGINDEYDYIKKLYSLFANGDEMYLSRQNKKLLIAEKVFGISKVFSGINTKEFLEDYFKVVLSEIIQEEIDGELKNLESPNENKIVGHIRMRMCLKLKRILSEILNDDEDGGKFIDACIYDYIRILSTNSLENVEVTINGKRIKISKDINADLLDLLPALKDECENLSESKGFADKILALFDINKDNLVLCKDTENVSKIAEVKKDEEQEYYYDPEGYLSKA